MHTPNDPLVVNNVARVLAAVKKATRSINLDYQKGEMHNNGFPYKVACKAEKGEKEEIKFKYTGRLGGDEKEKVFTAVEETGTEVTVLFYFFLFFTEKKN